jgi:pimeloyl-ACP methyl ester carboxylesterase
VNVPPPGGDCHEDGATMSYANVNGVNVYYEEHGSGQPLVLLHGGLGAAGMYAPILPMLAKDRRVIAVDLQAHGHTADVDRPLRYQTLGDDVAALIRHLGLAQADRWATPSAV